MSSHQQSGSSRAPVSAGHHAAGTPSTGQHKESGGSHTPATGNGVDGRGLDSSGIPLSSINFFASEPSKEQPASPPAPPLPANKEKPAGKDRAGAGAERQPAPSLDAPKGINFGSWSADANQLVSSPPHSSGVQGPQQLGSTPAPAAAPVENGQVSGPGNKGRRQLQPQQQQLGGSGAFPGHPQQMRPSGHFTGGNGPRRREDTRPGSQQQHQGMQQQAPGGLPQHAQHGMLQGSMPLPYGGPQPGMMHMASMGLQQGMQHIQLPPGMMAYHPQAWGGVMAPYNMGMMGPNMGVPHQQFYPQMGPQMPLGGAGARGGYRSGQAPPGGQPPPPQRGAHLAQQQGGPDQPEREGGYHPHQQSPSQQQQQPGHGPQQGGHGQHGAGPGRMTPAMSGDSSSSGSGLLGGAQGAHPRSGQHGRPGPQPQHSSPQQAPASHGLGPAGLQQQPGQHLQQPLPQVKPREKRVLKIVNPDTQEVVVPPQHQAAPARAPEGKPAAPSPGARSDSASDASRAASQEALRAAVASAARSQSEGKPRGQGAPAKEPAAAPTRPPQPAPAHEAGTAHEASRAVEGTAAAGAKQKAAEQVPDGQGKAASRVQAPATPEGKPGAAAAASTAGAKAAEQVQPAPASSAGAARAETQAAAPAAKPGDGKLNHRPASTTATKPAEAPAAAAGQAAAGPQAGDQPTGTSQQAAHAKPAEGTSAASAAGDAAAGPAQPPAAAVAQAAPEAPAPSAQPQQAAKPAAAGEEAVANGRPAVARGTDAEQWPEAAAVVPEVAHTGTPDADTMTVAVALGPAASKGPAVAESVEPSTGPPAAEPEQPQHASAESDAAEPAAEEGSKANDLAAAAARSMGEQKPAVVQPAAEAAPGKDEPSAAAAAAPQQPALSAKQKRQAMLRSADARGAPSDADPFQSPAQQQQAAIEKKAAAAEAAAAAAAPAQKAAPEPAADRMRSAEVAESWDDQASPRQVAPVRGAAPAGSKTARDDRVYSHDFLVNFRGRMECRLLPPGFERDPVLMKDTAVTKGPNGRMDAVEMDPRGRGGGRGAPPPRGGPPDKWQQPGVPVPAGGGGRGGARGAAPLEDKWGKRALPPPPPGAGGGYRGGAPLPDLHKTENKFQIGQVSADDPEEGRKQKAIKGLLNKITPEKFDKILTDLVAVGYETAKTEYGLISQVFDKALTETTFCEIYAELCYQLTSKLPTFEEHVEGKKPASTFRKQLLNKCQEEFMKGSAAMDAVVARERAEKDKTAEQKAKEAAEDAEAGDGADEVKQDDDMEEGEIVQEAAAAEEPATPEKAEKDMTPTERRAARLKARRAAAQAAADELKARRRALGNIQFIGHLYRKRMLTERIMHECIKKLLSEVDNPKQEDLECLTKLLTTIGVQLESSKAGRAEETIDMYYNRIQTLSNHQGLESRMRFMLKDLLELRANNYVPRRKVEGPKTISQVHKDARTEQANARNAPPPPRRAASHLDAYGGPPRRPQPLRQDTQLDGPVRAMQRNSSQEFSLRPGGAPTSLRPGGAQRPAGPAAAQRQASVPAPAPAAHQPSRQPAAAAAAEAATAPASQLDAKEVRNRVNGLLAQFLSVDHDMDEAVTSVKELQSAHVAMPAVVETLFLVALEMRGVDWGEMQRLVMHLGGSEGPVSAADMQQGMVKLVHYMAAQDMFTDSPKATDWIGAVLGSLVASGSVQLKSLGEAVLHAGEGADQDEDAPLVDNEFGVKLLAATLQVIKEEESLDAVTEQWKATGLDLLVFLPSFARSDDDLRKQLLPYGVEALV